MLAHEMCSVKCLGYCIKQIDSILLWVCILITHRGRQNVVRTSVTLRAARFDVICALSEYMQTHGKMESIC